MTTTLQRRAERPPVADVVRMSTFALRAEADTENGDGNTLDGYAAVFNSETIIDSWEGRFKEKIAPGSMRKSFREKPPVIQFDHGRHPLVGSIPIARLDSISEDVDPALAPEGGAHVVGTLHDNWLVQPVRDAIASRSIDGMSFRFTVVRDEWRDHSGRKITKPEELQDLLRRSWLEDVPDDELLVRTLVEVRVHELGPVVFPAYADTSVAVRSQVIDLAHLDDPNTRSLLAQAVLMADQIEAEGVDSSAPQDTATDATTQVVASEPAVEHPAESDDTPRSTSSDSEDAGEHLSTMTRFDTRQALQEMGLADIWRTINDTKVRYAP